MSFAFFFVNSCKKRGNAPTKKEKENTEEEKKKFGLLIPVFTLKDKSSTNLVRFFFY